MLVEIQGSANPQAPGLVNFVPNLPKAFSQPGARGLADPCRERRMGRREGSIAELYEGEKRDIFVKHLIIIDISVPKQNIIIYIFQQCQAYT